jgi:phospholipid transport system transporter-binding protein
MYIPQKSASATVDVVEVSPNRMDVKGALNYITARRAREAGLRVLQGSSSREAITVDCSGVGDADSAGLAVLIDWLATASKQGRGLQFSNLPPGILASAKISDVETILGLASTS